LTGRTVDVHEALIAGFIHRVVSPEANLMQLSLDLARSLTQFPEQALAATKALIQVAAN